MLEKIRTLLAREGMTQEELEQLAGLAKNRITKWKDDQGEPTARQALRMARVLKAPVSWLIDDDAPGDLPLGDGAHAGADLSPAERAILRLVHALRLSEDEAMRRIAGAGLTTLPYTPPLPPERQADLDQLRENGRREAAATRKPTPRRRAHRKA